MTKINRWEKLVEEYKAFIDNNKRSGSGRHEFMYEEEMREIFEDDPVFNPVYNSETRKNTDSNEEHKMKRVKKEKGKEKKKSSSETVTIIKELYEQNARHTMEFQDKLLSVLSGLVTSLNSKDNDGNASN